MIYNKSMYSIPTHYEVVEENGLKGLKRKGKDGEKWVLDPIFSHIIVGRSYGKILICAKLATDTSNYMLLYKFTGKLAMNIRVYDIIFGKEFLYIKTIKPSSGELEWCLVNEELTGGKFLGDIEFVERNSSVPFHVKIGYTNTKIKLDDKLCDLHYSTGELTEIVEKTVREVEEAKYCNIYFKLREDGDEEKVSNPLNCVYLLNPKNNSEIMRSTSIGELEYYTSAISTILGGTEGIPIERAKKLIECLNMIEKYGNGIMLLILSEYALDRIGGSEDIDERDAVVDFMVKELTSGWEKLDDEGSLCKIYTSGSIVLTLLKMVHGKITVVPFMINEGDNIISDDDIGKLRECYGITGCKTTKLEITKAKTIEKTNEFEGYGDLLAMPYSVEQRKKLKDQIKNISYRYVEELEMGCRILGRDGNGYGDISFNLVVFNDFLYLNKKKSKSAGGEVIRTNIKHLQVI